MFYFIICYFTVIFFIEMAVLGAFLATEKSVKNIKCYLFRGQHYCRNCGLFFRERQGWTDDPNPDYYPMEVEINPKEDIKCNCCMRFVSRVNWWQ